MCTGNVWKNFLRRISQYQETTYRFPHPETIKRITMLIEKFPSRINDDGNNTLLHYLSEIHSDVTIQNLITANFDVDIPYYKENPIDRDEVMIEIIKMLIQGGIDINAKNYYGLTALHQAVLIGNECIVDQLLKAGADPNAFDREFYTPLHMSMQDEVQITLVKRLIEAGTNVNAQDSTGRSCVFHAARYASVELLNLLIDNGATINLIDVVGRNPLRCALQSWAIDNLSVLIKLGTNNLNQLDYDLVIENELGKYKIENQLECIEILLKQGMKINNIIKYDNVLRDHLSTFQHTKVLCKLLRRGGIFNFKLLNGFNNSFIFKLKILKIYIRHAAVCNFFKNVKGIVNFDYEKLNEEQKQYYEDCVKELQKLKNCLVYESMPLSNLIEGPVSSYYIFHKNLIEMFESGFIARTYPICSDLLIECFEEEREKHKLLLAATAGLQRLINFNNYSIDLIYCNILKYLGPKDQQIVASFANTEISESTSQA